MALDDGRPVGRVEGTARDWVSSATSDADLTGNGAVLQRVCRGAARALSLRGCAIHLVGSAGTTVLAASSDAWAAEVADLAFAVAEGPSVEALARRRPVLVNDLGRRRDRWPGFVETAGSHDVAAVFSFPLALGGLVLGVLELFSSEVHALRDEEATLTLAFVELTCQILLGDQSPDGTWEPLVDHRAQIHQAQGMVMVDLGLDLAEALVRMRAHAFAQGVPMIELAHAIIAGLVLPPSGEASST